MKQALFILLAIVHTCTYAQKEDYVWFLGKDQSTDPGIQGMVWDWNTQNAEPEMLDLAYGVDNNNASICDKDGNLLFWSNGCAVINREQEVMPNGDTLNWDLFREVIGWEECIRGYPGVQNIKILPDPGNENGFYIFHKAIRYLGQFEDITTDLRFSYVDMTLDSGLGDVTYFDSILYDAPVTPHNLEAVPVDNGEDWWILQPIEDESLFLTYKLDQDGIEKYPDQDSEVNFQKYRSGAGTMRISPDGTKLAYYNYLLNLHIYDFNRTTGEISNHQKVTIFDDAEDMPNSAFRFGSVEWSPNSRFMYVAVRDSLFQVDSWEEDMNDGIRLIDVYDGTQNPFSTTFYVASLAPDCKIYICSTSGNKSYHVIHKPDELGEACNFVQNGLELPQYAGSANLPLFPRFRVDEEEKCDPTITSVFGDAVFYRRDLKVFPNPTSGPATVVLPADWTGGTLLVFDAKGRAVENRDVPSSTDQIRIDFAGLPAGTYNVELYPAERERRVFYGQRMVISR